MVCCNNPENSQKVNNKVFKGYFISIQQNKRNVKRKKSPDREIEGL